jgi:small subunit ribosomal protein S11
MGKKRIVKTDTEIEKGKVKANAAESSNSPIQTDLPTQTSKKRVEAGILFVRSTYNNTQLVLTDKKGNVIGSESSGKLGFRGAKKGTPFAAAKVGETLGTKAQGLGMKEISVVVKGVGSGRESGIRGFISKGINISSIKDATPVPHNGPKPKKPRRV